MHGYGASMHDLSEIAPIINDKDFIYVFPNAPLEMNIGVGQKGYAWFPIEDFNISNSENLLDKTINEILDMFKNNIDEVYIGGFSQGGMMTLNSNFSNSSLFKGAIILSSRSIQKYDIKLKSKTKIFMSHGTEDSIIPVEEGRDTKNKLNKLGFEVDYNEYNIGHEISMEVINNLKIWISR
jgi:phospholipase/carboxylesterase|tara:strand:+ start:45 stop:587 length:543 start_codon:yes stop_codon:yes gene_type:complete